MLNIDVHMTKVLPGDLWPSKFLTVVWETNIIFLVSKQCVKVENVGTMYKVVKDINSIIGNTYCKYLNY